MGKIKCLIVDDEAPARRIIEGFLERVDEAVLVASVKNAVEAFNVLQKDKVDVIYLDINMPEITGISLLKMLQSHPVVILTTAYSEYGVESYEYNVTDYLLKPIRFERFLKSFEKARNTIMNQSIATEGKFTQEYFEFKVDREMKKVAIKDILYLQSLGNYLKVFTARKIYLTPLTTKEAEEHLKDLNFLRLHKSIIVNTAFITAYTSETVTINETVLAIGKTYRKYVMKKLKELDV